VGSCHHFGEAKNWWRKCFVEMQVLPNGKNNSYTRVEAHLLQIKGKGISPCPNVTYQMLCAMRREVDKCKDLVERGKKNTVSLPVAPSASNSNKKKRGPPSELEKSWALQDRKHLDALIVRAMYSGGISFNFLRKSIIKRSFCICLQPQFARLHNPWI
jgi:hypothetical protein